MSHNDIVMIVCVCEICLNERPNYLFPHFYLTNSHENVDTEFSLKALNSSRRNVAHVSYTESNQPVQSPSSWEGIP